LKAGENFSVNLNIYTLLQVLSLSSHYIATTIVYMWQLVFFAVSNVWEDH